MLLEIVLGDFDKLLTQIYVVFLAWLIVILAIGIDLYFGIKKSKQTGLYVHSYGLRQTSKKTVQYLSFMFFFFFIDVLNPFWVYFDYQSMPLLSIFGAIVLTYTEYKSVREKSDEKFRNDFDGNAKELYKLLKENKDFLKELDKRKTKENGSDL
ncbi:MAG: holin [Weeksellaceae bacterium]